MAIASISTPTTFLSSSSIFSSQSVSFSVSSNSLHVRRRQQILCKALTESNPSCPIPTRRGLSISFIAGLCFFSLSGKGNAAILEADDDLELLEKVKQDRKKRLERQGLVSSSKKETGYLQEAVYKLSQVGQAIDNNDLSAASSVLGGSTDTDWVKKANAAFTKLSFGPEEMSQVDTFNSSLASLISSVTKKDVESSKNAFVASANALEKWTSLAGLVGQLKGL